MNDVRNSKNLMKKEIGAELTKAVKKRYNQIVAIIHPGETLAEVIEDRNMTQRELAVRTGMTEKHISTVIHGQKSISAAFARKLEYALGIETSFWMNLQANYDRELLEFEELNNITEEELSVLKNLKEVTEVWTAFGWLDGGADYSLERSTEIRMGIRIF